MTGPLDPTHNQFKFYCQNCKTNVTIYSKRAREIIRHYQGESHLRKYQRWRFEHLSITYKVTGITQHQVRGKDCHVLTPLELERETPLFQKAPLVDVGEKLPFTTSTSQILEASRSLRTSETVPRQYSLENLFPMTATSSCSRHSGPE